ncbi:Gfo/Idh/MocA family protein [Paenibacillus cymbidii]|uniref:Gfo/Idh/MocA family protein n=1 Tax=Paenibacillus cymbidii TaxID=1639034 RepID=UPI001436B6B0|nr:Gfo/Idh/MocA family oxidoreductase [Paenibacillus cymbidii]
MTEKLRLCVVGAGRVAESHLPAIQALAERIELAALVARDERRLLEKAARWHVSQTYTSYEQALQDERIDAVLLLLPHDLHADYTIRALRAGKHVLVEKPMAMNDAEAARMTEEAERNGKVLMIGQSRRFFAPVMESIRQIRAKTIGEVININALLLAHMDKPAVEWWKDKSRIGGFIIPLWGSHILDYILWAYDELPETVYAQGLSNNPNWDGEDEAAISLRFSGGRMANLLLSFNAGCRPTDEGGLTANRIWSTRNSIYERYIIGTNGLIHLRDEQELFVNNVKIDTEEEHVSNFAWQIKEFADAIRERREPLASGREVRRVVQVIDAVFASMNENRLIRLNKEAAH